MNSPSFYKNISGGHEINELTGGSAVLLTNLPLVSEPLRVKAEINIFGTVRATYKHALKKRYDCFVRVQKEGDNEWKTLPSYTLSPVGGVSSSIKIQNITENEITIEFESVTNGVYNIEIYFINFWI